jgi:type I restriction enzyme S subunit
MSQTVALGDLIEIKHGYAFRGEHFSDRPTEDILVTPGNFKIGGGFSDAKLKYYAGPISSDYVLASGDIIITMTDLSKEADTLGFSAKVPIAKDKRRYLHNQRIGLVKPKREGVNLDYLFWLMRSKPYRDYIVSSATGSTVKHTSPSRILSYRFPLPEPSTQKKIAESLNAIDEKIELNRRMNETLEQVGQNLFSHFFIDDPRHSEWNRGKLDELVGVNTESVGKDYANSDILYVDIASVSSGSIERIERMSLRSAPSRAKRVVRDGDIIWATVRPNRRAFALIMEPPSNLIVSTGFAVISSQQYALGYIYYLMSSRAFTDYLTLRAKGAAYPAVTATDFREAPILIPDEPTLKKFNALVLPKMQAMCKLKQEIQTLTTLRDTLLPRLMSGKLAP